MRIIGLAAGLALAVSGSAHAAPENGDAQGMAAATAQLAKVGGAYEALGHESVQLILFDVDGANRALQLAGGADADSWASTWQAQLDAKVDALNADLAAMPSNAEALAAFGKFAPAEAAKIRALDLPGQTRAVAQSALQLSAAIRVDVEPALANDDAAKHRLEIDLVDGLRGELTAENTLMTGEMGAMDSAHPQRALLMSVLSSNEAIMGLYDALDGQLRGRPVDLKALAASTHNLCGDARANAQQVAPSAAAMRPMIDLHGRVTADVQARWFQAWDSYAESGQVEVAVADQCDKVAAALDQGMPIVQAIQQAPGLKDLVNRRVALQTDRRATLAQDR